MYICIDRVAKFLLVVIVGHTVFGGILRGPLCLEIPICQGCSGVPMCRIPICSEIPSGHIPDSHPKPRRTPLHQDHLVARLYEWSRQEIQAVLQGNRTSTSWFSMHKGLALHN